MTARTGRGQVLVLFALMLVVFLGFAALAIDLSGVYVELRAERGAADAAALAGASDAYREGSNAVGAPEYEKARGHAMQNIVDALDQSWDAATDPLPTCSGDSAPYAADIVNCPIAGTPFYVSIYAPAPTCVTLGGCDALRSVQVTVRNPAHGLTFARVFGQDKWNLAVTSIAERNRGTNYSFVTLRPPKPSRRSDPGCAPNCDANDDDVGLDGSGTTLTVRGDMATNTNMILTNGASVVLTETESVVDRYDAYKGWTGSPADRQIATPVNDPNYPIPAPVPNDAAHATLIHAGTVSAEMTSADCTAEVAKIPGSYNGALATPVNAAGVSGGSVKCLKPGRYTYNPAAYAASVKSLVFSAGVYFFEKGLKPGNNMQMVGGYEPGAPGVAFVFEPRCSGGGGCEFAGNALDRLVLNAGAAYPGGTGAVATAAVNWDGSIVETTGRVPLPMTLIVKKNAACFVALTDPCDVNPSQWRQLTLPGGSNSAVYGVQYAPTDNVFITGGSGSDGILGQIWAWTVKYSGGTRITLIGANNPEPGVLRLATPCSPTAACTNPEATVAIP